MKAVLSNEGNLIITHTYSLPFKFFDYSWHFSSWLCFQCHLTLHREMHERKIGMLCSMNIKRNSFVRFWESILSFKANINTKSRLRFLNIKADRPYPTSDKCQSDAKRRKKKNGPTTLYYKIVYLGPQGIMKTWVSYQPIPCTLLSLGMARFWFS